MKFCYSLYIVHETKFTRTLMWKILDCSGYYTKKMQNIAKTGMKSFEISVQMLIISFDSEIYHFWLMPQQMSCKVTLPTLTQYLQLLKLVLVKNSLYKHIDSFPLLYYHTYLCYHVLRSPPTLSSHFSNFLQFFLMWTYDFLILFTF